MRITKSKLKKIIQEELKTLLEDIDPLYKDLGKEDEEKQMSMPTQASEFEQSTPVDPKNLDPVHHTADYIATRLQKVFDPKTYKKKKNK